MRLFVCVCVRGGWDPNSLPTTLGWNSQVKSQMKIIPVCQKLTWPFKLGSKNEQDVDAREISIPKSISQQC